MSASKQAKQAGLKSLAEACKISGQSPQTLHNWHKRKPELFHVVILGCVQLKSEGRK